MLPMACSLQHGKRSVHANELRLRVLSLQGTEVRAFAASQVQNALGLQFHKRKALMHAPCNFAAQKI